jgi:hypothetical protein
MVLPSQDGEEMPGRKRVAVAFAVYVGFYLFA